jgi:hypothetical protein
LSRRNFRRDRQATSSFADPGFFSRIPYIGPRIQKQQQKRRVKKNFCLTFFVATNITKLKIILFFSR